MSFSKADVDTAIAVLRAAAQSEELSEQLQSAVGIFNRRQKQRQRQRQQAERSTAEPTPEPSTPAPACTDADFSVVQLAPPHLSRPLYPNPVCFLSTWKPSSTQRNLMTISWITAIDNDGRFFASMNQKRHSATMLMAHPYLVLTVACAGLEPLLTRVGGCSGSRMDKTTTLDVPICRPGWAVLDDEAAHTRSRQAAQEDEAKGSEPVEESEEEEEDDDDEDAMLRRMTGAHVARALSGAKSHVQLPEAEENDDGSGTVRAVGATQPWPADGQMSLGAAKNEASTHAALADAFAVAPGVAHVCAKVTHVRGAHGHYMLTCETLTAFVRSQYWSGKTLEREDSALPPILSFVGSQRFGHVVGATGTDSGPAAGEVAVTPVS